MGTLVTRIAVTGATAVAAIVARRAVEFGWTALRGEDPPTSGDVSNDTELRDLLLWSAVLAAAIALARKVATSGTRQLLGDE